jgi:hypothetical protein
MREEVLEEVGETKVWTRLGGRRVEVVVEAGQREDSNSDSEFCVLQLAWYLIYVFLATAFVLSHVWYLFVRTSFKRITGSAV